MYLQTDYGLFQSLLFWIIGSGKNQPVDLFEFFVVSILVVLDHWFGPYGGDLLCHPAFAFQSLLFWIIGSGRRLVVMLCSICQFQSLLFWIIGSGFQEGNQKMSVRDCFNPCCFGSLVRARALIDWACRTSGFQSLLFWIIGSGRLPIDL